MSCQRVSAAALVLVLILTWLTISASAAPLPGNPTDAVTEAENLTPLCRLDISHDPGAASVILDQNRSTRFTFQSNATLRITSETPVSQLYIVWDKPPSPWLLESSITEGTVTHAETFGQYGFIHEYVAFENPANVLVFTLPEEQAVLCDVYAFGEGETPTWVQCWQPPYQQADMLVLPTHADDEHLFFGGTLPYYAGELGLKVQVAYLTNHWGEYYRPHELLNGLWEVGVTAYPIMGPFDDLYSENLATAESQYGREEVTLYLVELLRRFKPFVVIGHDLNGEYGHGAHMLNAHALLDAVQVSHHPEYAPELTNIYGVWDVPKLYLHLYPVNEITMDWDMPLDRFSKTAYEMAVAGFAHHISQQTYFRVEHWGPYDCRKFGLAHTRVGPDLVGGDFLENIILPATVVPEPDPEHLPEVTIPPEPTPEPELSTSQISEPPPVPEEESSLNITAYLPILVVGVLALVCALLLFARRKK